MKAGVPWSVKGIEPETRAAAKAAARRAGLTLGEWLSQKINETDDAETAASLRRSLDAFDPYGAELGHGDHRRPQSPHLASFDWAETSPTLSVMMERLNKLESEQRQAIGHVEQAVAVLAQRLQLASPGQTDQGASFERRLAKLELDGAIRHTRLDNSLEQIVERADALDTKLSKIEDDSLAAAQTFETVFSAVAKRLGTIERRQSDHADLLEQAVGRLSEGLAEVVRRETAGGLGAVRTLEHAVEEITRHFETLETRREATQKLVESALSALADRIAEADLKLTKSATNPAEAIDRAVERMQLRLQDSEKRTSDALAAFDSRLHELSTRIHGEPLRPAAPPIAEPAPEAVEPETEPVSLAELASDIIAHDRKRGVGREKVDGWEEAVAPVQEALPEPEPEPDPFADVLAAASEGEPPAAKEERPGQDLTKQELSEDIQALLGAARLIARAEDPAMAEALPDEAAPDIAVDDRVAELETEEPATPNVRPASLGSLAGVELGERRRTRAVARARREQRQKQFALALGLLAGSAVGGLLLVNYGGGTDALSATRPGLAPSLVGAVRSVVDDIGGKIDRLLSPEPQVAEPQADGPRVVPLTGTSTGGTSPDKTAPPAGALAPLASRDVRTLPAAPMVEPGAIVPSPAKPTPSNTPKPAAPAAGNAEELSVRAYAVDAIKALKAARTVPEEAAAAQRVGHAAALGDADAQFALGRLYETGRSVTHDPEAARRWYAEAARAGNAEASFNLGMMEISRGGEGAYERAASYFRAAAERGNVDAQVNLALLYEQGLGVPRDDALALDWYAKAALRGDPEATRARDRLAKRRGTP